jgi:hypothetical protein
VRRLVVALVRLAGGRPDIVLALAVALDQAAEGQAELLRERNPRQALIPPKAMRLLMYVIAVLGSAILAILFVTRMPESHPHPGVLVISLVHWFLVANLVLAQAGPSLLMDDDAQVLGGWPLSHREILLARLGLLLRPALAVTLAVSALPLVAYAFVGRPPVLQALSFLVGLLVQTVGVAFGVALGLVLLLRWWGRRRAQRLAGMLADGNAQAYVLLLVYPVRLAWDWLWAHPAVLYAFPGGWPVAWGDWRSPAVAWTWAGIGLVLNAVGVVFGFRLLAPAHRGREVAPAARRPAARHPSRLVAAVLRPFTRSREGAVLRRLVEAHLRDDWRVVGTVVTPIVFLIWMVFDPSELGETFAPDSLRLTAMRTVPYIHLYFVMAVLAAFTTVSSSRPEAMWLVALGDLDGGRLLASMRAVTHVMLVGPMLAIYVLRAIMAGAAPLVALRDVVLIWLEIDVLLLLLQPLLPLMPFSQPFARNEFGRRVGVVIGGSIASLVPVLVNQAYIHVAGAAWFFWLGLPLLWLGTRRLYHRRTRGIRLEMDVVTTAT